MKTAYHRALLRHHPDKCSIDSYTVDQITTAYRVLSDPRLRTEYDLSLRLNASLGGPAPRTDGDSGETADDINDVFRTGLEIFDLEDMTEIGEADTSNLDDERHAEDRDVESNKEVSKSTWWYHPCRCGDSSGFRLSEEDLLSEAKNGEVIIGCEGCSLWAKVLFAVEDSEETTADNENIDQTQ